MAITIEYGIALPRGSGPIGPTSEHGQALNSMEIGGSFAIPKGVSIGTIRSLAARYGKQLGRKFAVRAGRVWRMA